MCASEPRCAARLTGTRRQTDKTGVEGGVKCLVCIWTHGGGVNVSSETHGLQLEMFSLIRHRMRTERLNFES